jgi:tetratricopeptide (TPR) repeat protein
MTRHGWVVVLLVGAVAWSNTTGNAFQYDDFHSIVDNVNLRDLDVGRFFADPGAFSVDADKGMYRPLLVTSFALNRAVGGVDPTGYHLVNIAVHLATAVVVWWLAGLLGAGGGARLVAGLLFVVHPVCSEPVNYISSRSESLSVLCYLTALALFVQAHRAGRGWLWGSWACLAAGLLTKSTAATLPAALLLLDAAVLQRGDLSALRRRFLRWHAPAWGLLLGYLLIVTQNTWLTRSLQQDVREPLSQWLTQLTALVWYAALLAVPTRLNVEPQFAVQPGLTVVVLVAAWVVLVWSGALLWSARRRHGRVVFLLALPVLHLLPTLIVPLNVLVNERRAYLPAAVVCLGVALLTRHRLRRQTRQPLVVAGVAVLALLSWQRGRAWADETSLWTAAVEAGPRMPRSHLYLGNAFKTAAMHSPAAADALQHWRAASTAFERAFHEAEGRDEELARRALNNRGGVHFALYYQTAGAQRLTELSQAEALFREVVERQPQFADALINLGSCLLERSRMATERTQRQRLLSESIDFYQRGLAVRPNHAQAHGNMGVALQELGRFDEAAAAYRHNLYLLPQDFTAHKNLAQLLTLQARRDVGEGNRGQAVERLREAVRLAERALRLNPATPGAREVLQAASQQLAALER